MGFKISKLPQKIFGSQSGLNQLAKFGSLAGGTPEYITVDQNHTNANLVQSLGNWLVGWYAATINGAAPAKQDMNSYFYLVTRQLAYIFQSGVAEWDAQTEYFTGSIVSVLGVLYTSKVDNNLANNPATDPVNWRLYSPTPTGVGMDFFGAAAPAGFVFASGRTIGNSASGATERANNDCYDLFALIWTGYADADYPIQDSAGNASTRGASALTDWNANKRITIFDKRDRASIGKGDMGGAAANIITTAANGFNAQKLGSTVGEAMHTLTQNEMPSHTHNDAGHGHQIWGDGRQNFDGGGRLPTVGQAGLEAWCATETGYANIQNTGGGAAHNNVQTSLVSNYIIKL